MLERGAVCQLGGGVHAAHGLRRPALYRLSPQRHRAGAPAHRLRPGGRNRAGDFRQLRARTFDEGLPGAGTAVRSCSGYAQAVEGGAALVARRLRGRQPQGAVGGSHPPDSPGVAFPYIGRIQGGAFPLRHHGGRGEGGIRRTGVSRLDLFGNRQGGQQDRQAFQVLRVRQGDGRRSPRKADAQRCRMGKDPQGGRRRHRRKGCRRHADRRA